jgi:hypothetical protein
LLPHPAPASSQASEHASGGPLAGMWRVRNPASRIPLPSAGRDHHDPTPDPVGAAPVPSTRSPGPP